MGIERNTAQTMKHNRPRFDSFCQRIDAYLMLQLPLSDSAPSRQADENLALMCMPTKPERGHDFDRTLQVSSLHATRQTFCFFGMSAKPERGHDFCPSLISACPKRALNLPGVCKLPKIHQVLQSLSNAMVSTRRCVSFQRAGSCRNRALARVWKAITSHGDFRLIQDGSSKI